MSLDELERIKRWHVEHRTDHPLESHLWDAMLTVWLAGWVGWLPAYAFNAVWAVPMCIAAMGAPSLYVTARGWAHRTRRLRCDWVV